MSDTNNEKTDWQKREMGALWKKDSGSQKYLTGHVKTESGVIEKVIIFSNKHKTKDNQPDFRVYRSEDRPQQEADSSGVDSPQEEDTL